MSTPVNSKDWDVEPKYTILWPSAFKGIKTFPMYAGKTNQVVQATVVGSFSDGEIAPKPVIHVFGEHNQSSEFRPHGFSWSARIAENCKAYVMLRWLLSNDQYFDVTIGAWDDKGDYLGIWAPDTESLVGCLVESRNVAYVLRSLPFSDFRGNFKRSACGIDPYSYGDGRKRSILTQVPAELPFVKYTMD